MKISMPNKGVTVTPLFVAKDLGLFAKRGIQAEIANVSPANAAAALQSGDLDFDGSPVTGTRAALKGLPVRVVLITTNKPDFVVIGAKGLTSVDQLRGKVVATNAPGSGSYQILVEVLKRKGLQSSDYKTVTGTSDDARMAAVTSGQAAAAITEVSVAPSFERQGYPVLVKMSDYEIAQPFAGFTASQAGLQNKHDFLRQGVQAMLEATALTKTHKDQVVPVISKEFDLSPADAAEVYDALQPGWTTDGKPTADAMAYEFASDQRDLELKDPIKPEQVYDFSLLAS